MGTGEGGGNFSCKLVLLPSCSNLQLLGPSGLPRATGGLRHSCPSPAQPAPSSSLAARIHAPAWQQETGLSDCITSGLGLELQLGQVTL